MQALGEHEEEEARKDAQLVRQQAKARAGQKAAAKKAAAKGKGKRSQWSDDEDELSDSEEEGEQAVVRGTLLGMRLDAALLGLTGVGRLLGLVHL